ncbi:MAG: HAD family phosphatase [Acidobacteria bacterium]|nr:HAD family phosphatase [Acidobacteriota bacterium]
MSRYDAILFDFDGVLADSEPIHYECWIEILRPFGLTMTYEWYCQRCIGVSDRRMIEVLASLANPPADAEELYAQYPAKKAIFRQRMLAAPPIFPSTLDLIGELKGHKLAVVTSSGESEVAPILEQAGLLHRFETCVFGGDVERLKPAPDPYLLAARRLGVTRPLVVEDSEAGLASGRAAGFETLHIPTPAALAATVRAHLGPA